MTWQFLLGHLTLEREVIERKWRGIVARVQINECYILSCMKLCLLSRRSKNCHGTKISPQTPREIASRSCNTTTGETCNTGKPNAALAASKNATRSLSDSREKKENSCENCNCKAKKKGDSVSQIRLSQFSLAKRPFRSFAHILVYFSSLLLT